MTGRTDGRARPACGSGPAGPAASEATTGRGARRTGGEHPDRRSPGSGGHPGDGPEGGGPAARRGARGAAAPHVPAAPATRGDRRSAGRDGGADHDGVPRRDAGPAARAGRRTAQALAAAGVLCVLAGVNLVAAVPAPVVGEIAAPGPVPAGSRLSPPAGPLAPPDGARLLSFAEPAPPRPAVVPGTAPVELTLPARDVRAPVVAVTTGPAGALLVPEPPSTVGWWSPSALAGSAAGTTVIAGHVDSRDAGLGALAVLRHVGAGEELVLRGADGRDFRYRVTARRQYAKAELPPEVFAAGGPARLVLITCGGAFDRATRHYADNVVVFAEPV
ncbi:class F sortase [Pseudonocardia kunmingensis]|uniref:Sortase family protein n=1 Tax=Pseudonocardia kunmingensis TaxID=630975 RepID=A0A543CYS1_9PSEU|nr:class F sortase [Pseudonocardia kunmingensis]TQM02229.1 sortase family protein [Pseudonocardia kunmingensis]